MKTAKRVRRTSSSIGLVAGVAGPLLFIAGWTLLGSARASYSPGSEPISELARSGTSAHVAMALVFVFYGASLLGYSTTLRTNSSLAARMVVIAHAASAFAVAATPLGTSNGDVLHAPAALTAYVSMALIPLCVPTVSKQAVFSTLSRNACSVAIGSSLLWSWAGPDDTTGLFQRLGLTIGDLWISGSAAIALIHWRRPQ